MLSRRSLLKTLAAVGSALLLPVDKLAKLRSPFPAQPEAPSEGDLYAGFLLLPSGAAVPSFVKYPVPGIPRVGDPNPTAVTRFFDTPLALAKATRFAVYSPSRLPAGFRAGSAYLVEHDTGEAFGAGVGFEWYNGVANTWECTLSIWAQPAFPRPYPLWSSDPGEPGAPAVVLERVTFLPSPGIMVSTPVGYAFHWIWEGVLYTMRAEYGPSREEAIDLASSLAPIA